MKCILVSLLLLLAAPVLAGELPVKYECEPDEGFPLENKFCDDLKAALIRTDFVTLDYEREGTYFYVVVLPTVRDGYISVAVAAHFVYPPFNGLVLSAFTGGYLIMPDLFDQQVADGIAVSVVDGMSSWMIYAEPKLSSVQRSRPMTLEVRND
jgi:hypothetical protein